MSVEERLGIKNIKNLYLNKLPVGLFWCNLVFIPQLNTQEKVHIIEKILRVGFGWRINLSFGPTSMQNNDVSVC